MYLVRNRLCAATIMIVQGGVKQGVEVVDSLMPALFHFVWLTVCLHHDTKLRVFAMEGLKHAVPDFEKCGDENAVLAAMGQGFASVNHWWLLYVGLRVT